MTTSDLRFISSGMIRWRIWPSVSSVFNRSKAQYLRAYLYTETDEADLGYFVDHHLDVILGAIDGLHGWLARKADERQRAEGMLRPGSRLGGKLNHRQRELLLDAVRLGKRGR